MATHRRSLNEPLSREGTAVVDREHDLVAALTSTSVLSPDTVMRGLRDRDDYTKARPIYDKAKRGFDILVALTAIVACAPFMLAIAVAIKLDSRGPVFFKQERLGKGTESFMIIKFRSMRVDADEIVQELAERNEQTGPLFKMKNDPRITRAGRLLRRTSLDELPQIFNVLLGTMSIVGPRPPLPRELNGFENVQRQRLQVKPGMAGLWQVSGRSNLTFDEMVRLDLEYIERRSFIFDVILVIKTVPAVLFARGAY